MTIPDWLFWWLIGDASLTILTLAQFSSKGSRWLSAGLLIGLLLAFGSNAV